MFNFFKKDEKNLGLKEADESNVDDLGQLIDHIISEAGLNALLPEDLQAIRESLGLQINRRLGLIILENLDDSGVDEYTKLLENGPIPDPKKLEEFLNQRIPGYQEKIKLGLNEFVAQAILSFKK